MLQGNHKVRQSRLLNHVIEAKSIIVLSYGKCHAEYMQESQLNVRYLPHETAGIEEEPGVLANPSSLEPRPCSSFIEFQISLDQIRHRAVFDHLNGTPDFFLQVADASGQVFYELELLRKGMRWSEFMVSVMSDGIRQGRGNTKDKPHRVRSTKVWVRPTGVKFGIDMMLGRDPCEWFREENVDQTIPTCLAETARVSIQCMLLSLEFLRICAIFNLPRSYMDLGLYAVRKELNFWNLELLLTYVVGGMPIEWDKDPSFGTIFEPMIPKVIAIAKTGVTDTYQVHFAGTSLLSTIGAFFDRNVPPLDNIATPSLASADLGAIMLDPNGHHGSIWSLLDASSLTPVPSEVKNHKRQLATFRIAAAVQLVTNPSPSIWQDHILPMILVSLPYGMLKFILYNMTNTSLIKRYELTRQVCVWRVERSVRWLQQYGTVTGRCILWKRLHWIYDPMRAPKESALPNRYRWIEVPFLLQRSDAQGRIIHIFDFKRYWYGWQEYNEGDELEARLRDIEQRDDFFANRLRNRVLYPGVASTGTVQGQHTVMRGEWQPAGQPAGQPAAGGEERRRGRGRPRGSGRGRASAQAARLGAGSPSISASQHHVNNPPVLLSQHHANNPPVLLSQQLQIANPIPTRPLPPPINLPGWIANSHQYTTPNTAPNQSTVNQPPSSHPSTDGGAVRQL